MAEEHPFQPGARVAIQQNYGWKGTTYREAFVDKVYKTGRFTLKDDPDRGQWKPYRGGWPEPRQWEASMSGYRGWLLIWDDTTDAMIAEARDIAAHDRRVRAAIDAVEQMKPSRVTPEAVAHLEAAIAAYAPDPA